MIKSKKTPIKKKPSIRPTNITEEAKKSYLNYAMSVIVMRALPDVRDGFKPVHRRILFAMSHMGLTPGGLYAKSAKVVGEVLGKYHPHGDTSVYDAMVRMAQDFSMRYPLIDGQGNFGSIDNDPPAAMRYTEARLAKISREVLADLKKDTIKMAPNFDNTMEEPTVLPAKTPNLLLNGADGIAVGMATKIPPHNLVEVIDAAILMLSKGRLEKITPANKFEIKKINLSGKSETDIILADVYKLEQEKQELETEVTAEELLKIVKGPDFPTAGIIFDRQAIREAYLTGRGKIPVRGKAEIKEGKRGRFQIIITQLPYQVNKANLVAKIAQLAKDKKIIGIADLRDESDRDGIRVVVDLKKIAMPKSVLNKLYKYTNLQTSYPANVVALVNGVPQTLTLKQILIYYLRHRHEVIRRRTIFDLKEAKLRSHILEGLKIALDNLDEVIETIKKSKNAQVAQKNLMAKFKFTSLQATAILDMQLRKLAALERKKIEAEYKETQKTVDQLVAILTTPKKMLMTIDKELKEIKQQYGDPRRTRVVARSIGNFSDEDLNPNKETIIAVTKTGYIKRMPKNTFRTQRRGGKGTMGMSKKEEDEIKHLIFAETHDHLLIFTNRGQVFQIRAWEIPESSRKAKGQAIINLINIAQGETIRAIIAKKKESKEKFVLVATKMGIIKKTALDKFAHIRASGIIALSMKSGDQLIEARLTTGKDNIFMVTQKGKCIRFPEANVRPMGRGARGVKGINLKPGDKVISANVIPEKLEQPADKRRKVFKDLLVITERGIGKRTDVYLFPLQKRGGTGVKVSNLTQRTGEIADAQVVDETIGQIIITSKQAQVIKLPLKNIPRLKRATQGVILMRFSKDSKDKAAAMTAIY